jgi:hypothetical protein
MESDIMHGRSSGRIASYLFTTNCTYINESCNINGFAWWTMKSSAREFRNSVFENPNDAPIIRHINSQFQRFAVTGQVLDIYVTILQVPLNKTHAAFKVRGDCLFDVPKTQYLNFTWVLQLPKQFECPKRPIHIIFTGHPQ